MPLSLSPLQESDIPAFVAAENAALSSYSYVQALAAATPAELSRTDELLNDFRSKDNKNGKTWLKISDENDKLLAGAIWRFQFHTKEPSEPIPSSSSASSMIPEIRRLGKEFDEKYRTGPHARM